MNVGYQYFKYKQLTSQKNPIIEAQVILQYTKTKNNKSYFVLKLQTDFGIFYTTSREDLKNIQERFIRGRFILNKVSFMDYLRGFYAPSFNLSLLPKKDYRQPFRDFIYSQHTTKEMGEYYLCLFLADPLPQNWRSLAQAFGISHIFAISGFHTGILMLVSFFVLSLLYIPLQQRFFPYRNRIFDLNIIVIILLITYYCLLSYSPSYLRALGMACFAMFLVYRGVNLLQLESFFWGVAIVIALFPKMVFSIGFYFSCMGVFYLLLYVKYAPKVSTNGGLLQKFNYAWWLNCSTFFLMGILVYYFFPYFSAWSLVSIVLTLLFVVYYPFILAAHLLGFGGILDGMLLWWSSHTYSTITLQPSIWLYYANLIISFFAAFYKQAYFLLLFLNVAYFCYGLILIVL